MVPVVSERPIDPPIGLDEVRAMEAQAAWCMEQYRVRHALTLLRRDGRHLVCLFEAPDAEAVRSVLQRVGAQIEHAWTATVHAPPSHPLTAPLQVDGQSLVVVERSFAEPTELAAVQAIEDRSAWCLDQHRVRFLRTFFSTDRRRMLCVYAAPDAEAVRLAQTQAGMPFERAWAASLYEAAG
jgi:hypothetical protein